MSIYNHSTYLEDEYRSAASPYPLVPRGAFSVIQEYRLPAVFPTVAETMAAVDAEKNLYFGAHDGVFYSLREDFSLRWILNTHASKIYSSPTVDSLGRVYFANANNQAFCLDGRTGKIVWKVSLWNPQQQNSRWAIKKKLLLSLPFYNYFPKKRFSSRCWSSPLVDESHVYWIGSVTGLVATSRDTGRVDWVYDLGFPRNYWSSPCLGSNGNLFASGQRRKVCCIERRSGRPEWITRIPCSGDIVGSLSYDVQLHRLLVTTYKNKSDGSVVSLDRYGHVIWVRNFKDGFRGGVAISGDRYVAAGSNGFLYSLSKDGEVLASERIASPQNRFGLWTNPIVSANGMTLIGTIQSDKCGEFLCLDKNLSRVGEFKTNKVLSPPRILEDGSVVFGAWDGIIRRARF